MIEALEVFKSIRPGDLVRVSFLPRGGMSDNWEMTHSREARVYGLWEGREWFTFDNQLLVDIRDAVNPKCRIEILGHWNEWVEILEHWSEEE